MSPKISVLVWIAIALGLVVLFSVYPGLAKAIPTGSSILVVAAVVTFGVIRSKRNGTLQENLKTKVVFGISAKHLMLVGMGLASAAFVWMNAILRFIEHPIPNGDLIVLVIAPTMLLMVTGVICIGSGLYYVLRQR